MMKVFKYFICFLRLHKWEYEGYYLHKSNPDTWRVSKRHCKRCGKKEELYYDIYDGRYWGKP